MHNISDLVAAGEGAGLAFFREKARTEELAETLVAPGAEDVCGR